MSGKHSLTATNLAVYQHLNCDLYIHNVYNGVVGAGTVSPDTGSSSPSELAKAQFKRGLDWESTLYTWLDNSDLLLKVPSIPLEMDSLMENILADDRSHFFVTGLSFWPPQDDLRRKFEAAGSRPLKFGLAKPDLLEIKRTAEGIQWRVIDAKAARHVKSSHHIQIYFYTLCLNYLLKPPHFCGTDSAGIWLPPRDGFHNNLPSVEDIKPISMSLLAAPLDTLILRILPKVIYMPQEDVKWHLNPLCNGCRYEPDCRARALEQGELGVMPNISIDDARNLKDLLRMSRAVHKSEKYDKPITDIEELDTLVANHGKLQHIAKSSPSVVKKSKLILALPKKSRGRDGEMGSPVIRAAISKKIQVIPRRNFTCPRTEDVAICITIVNDAASPNPGGDYFHAVSFSEKSNISVPHPIVCSEDCFITELANLIRNLESAGRTAQFYVWSSGEQGLLQTHIINAALTSTASDTDIRLCIGALSQGASLLQTAFQPLLLSGALMGFLGKGKRRKAEYQKCLARLGLSTEGTVDTLRKRLEGEILKLQEDSATTGSEEDRRKEFGQLPRVVVLKKEIERQLALPVPGYWDLPECVMELLGTLEGACPSDEEVFTAYRKTEDIDVLRDILSRRNKLMYAVLKELRIRAVSASGHSLFVNDAKRISTRFMDFCKQPQLRKLFFMQQFEVLAKLTELWQSRIDSCPDAPTLEYCGQRQGRTGQEHTFRVLSGTVDVPSSDKDRAFYDKIITLDTQNFLDDEETGDNLPVEALFDDLGVSGLVFPLNRYTKANWGCQEPRVQAELSMADLRNVYMDSGSRGTMVALKTWGTSAIPFVQGSVYRISPRLVDFNTTKVLSALFELDLEWEYGLDELLPEEQENSPHAFVPFVQLILDPNSLWKVPGTEHFVKAENDIQRLFRDLRELGNTTAGSLVLKASQHRATQRILDNRLSVIWGPPGTGKTYTISLSLLRLIEVERREWGPQPKIVFITAITHAAIEACRSKLVRLKDTYASIPDLPTEWLDDVKIEVVSNGNDHPGPRKVGNSVQIYMGTIYQLYNFTKKQSMEVDCVIVDEAGQISLGSLSLVLRSLAPYGRIIVAGDSEQLAPILSAQYPLLKSHSLFGSVLDCLMFSRLSLHGTDRARQESQNESQEVDTMPPSSQGTIIQLTENFRLNPDLGEFVSTIYSRQFKPQKVQARQLATALKTVADINGAKFGLNAKVFKAVQTFLTSLSDVMLTQPQSVLIAPEVHAKPSTRPLVGTDETAITHRPVSLALVKMRTWSAHTQNISYELHVQGEAAVAAALVLSLQKCAPNDDIFVATPHRIQREAVKAALVRIRARDATLEEAFGRLQVGDAPDDTGSKVTVDTIERLQGSEASFVICLFSVPTMHTVDLGFLLERRRLNVAISRAKTLCILISSDEVLCPSVKILANEETAKGYAFLKAFQKRAWSYSLPVQVDNLQL